MRRSEPKAWLRKGRRTVEVPATDRVLSENELRRFLAKIGMSEERFLELYRQFEDEIDGLEPS